MQGSEPGSEWLLLWTCPVTPRAMCCVPASLPATQPRSLPLVAPPQLLDTPSYYGKWIEKDLEPWNGGITRVGGAGCCSSASVWQCRLLLLLAVTRAAVIVCSNELRACTPVSACQTPASPSPPPPGRTWLRALPSCTTCVTAT